MAVRLSELRPNHERLDPADQEEPERRPEVEQPDPLVIGGGEPGLEANGATHLRLPRYATRAAMSASVRGGFMRVMRTPGLSDGASAIQLARCAESFGNRPAATVVRLPRWVRFGPMIPGETPWIVWQPMHAERENTAFPCSARLAFGGVAGPPFCSSTHAWNAESRSTSTRKRMLPWEAPQNSAHWPE